MLKIAYFRHQKQKEKAKKFSYEEAKKKKEAKQHSKKAQVYVGIKKKTIHWMNWLHLSVITIILRN